MKWDPTICRVCLKSSSDNVDLRIKVEFKDDCNYLDLFNTCTNLEANLDDELPFSICCGCSNDLIVSFDFLKRAIDSDTYLRNMLNEKTEYYTNFEEVDKDKDDEEALAVQGSCFSEIDPNYADETSLDEKQCLPVKSTFEIEIRSPSYDDNDELSEEDNNKLDAGTETKLTIECVSNEELKDGYKCNNATKGKEIIACDICGKRLRRWSMKHHYERCHRKERQYLCSACPKIFTIPSDLKIHMKTHDKSRERNYFCIICRKGFFEKQSLGVHMLRHTGIKEYQCDVCSKKFTTKRSLEVHEFTHNRQNGRFVCKYCDKRFPSNADLIVHERFHTGDYPYKCDICDKSYAVKSHYNYHMGKHKGVTYKCDQCDKQFKNRGSLTAHKYKHRDRMPHECPVCNKGFPSLFKLNRHQNSHKPKHSEVSLE